MLVEEPDHDGAKVLRQRFALPLLQVERVAHAGDEDELMLNSQRGQCPVQFHGLLPIDCRVRQTVEDEGRQGIGVAGTGQAGHGRDGCEFSGE